MERKEQLLKLIEKCDNKSSIINLIDEVVFLETKLDELRKLPFLKIHPDFPDCQKATPASKQYKELLQQYTICIKILSNSIGGEENKSESPLREWAKMRGLNE